MLNNTHALIIDDDSFNLEVMERFLTSSGMVCDRAQNVKHLRAILADNPPLDLVFLDLEMPQMDGYDVFRLLRDTLGDTIPIVACTVHMNEMGRVRETGFDGFIAKPLDQKRFPQQVQRILQGEQVWET